MKKLITKRIIAMLLALVLCVGAIPLASIHASAASNWPSLSDSSYCEFTATKTIYVYRDGSFSARGTCIPSKSYNAYIEAGDVCKIYYITSKAILVGYPVGGGSYRVGYIKRSDLLGVSAPTACITSKGKATTYVSPGGSSYGYTESGDKVYSCGTSGSYTLIIYSAKSGSRAYKLAYVKTSDLRSKVGGPTSNTWTTTVTINASSLEEWSTEIKQAEMSVRGVGHLVGNANGTWIESNVIVGREILSYKRIKVFIPGYGPVTSNSTYGKTVYVNIPYKIRYTIHRHEYGTKANAQYWGNFMVGLVNMKIVHTQQCNCGKAYTCTWEMPDMTIEKVNVGQTYTVTSRVYQK